MTLSCAISLMLVFLFTIATSLSVSRMIQHGGTLHAHGTLSIYVADVPAAYVTGTYGKGAEETNLQYGHASFGPLLSAEHEQWASTWHSVTAWYIEQIKTSPLRTYDAASADIIFVPAMLNQADPAQQDRFIAAVDQFLPFLTTKPHLIVLTHAPDWYYSQLLKHVNSHSFVFVSWGQLTGWSPNFVGSPAFSFIHWSRGSEHLQTKQRSFDAKATETSKTILVAESFVVRDYPDRFAVFDDCAAAPENCTHLNFTSLSNGTAAFKAFRSAWYVLHPKGEFLTRNSLYDTLLADAVPVFFQAEYIDSVPFADILNYTTIAVYIPQDEVVGDNKTKVVQRLAQDFDKQEVLSQIEYIHAVRHLFQYMQNPDHDLIRWDQRSTVHPDDDAFTFTMKSVLRNLCNRTWRAKKCGVISRLIAEKKQLVAKLSEVSRTKIVHQKATRRLQRHVEGFEGS